MSDGEASSSSAAAPQQQQKQTLWQMRNTKVRRFHIMDDRQAL
jgi:hypothetical protein